MTYEEAVKNYNVAQATYDDFVATRVAQIAARRKALLAVVERKLRAEFHDPEFDEKANVLEHAAEVASGAMFMAGLQDGQK